MSEDVIRHTFDVEHIGAEMAEHHRGVRPGTDTCQFDDSQSVHWSRHAVTALQQCAHSIARSLDWATMGPMFAIETHCSTAGYRVPAGEAPGQRVTRVCRRAMISSRTAGRRALPASSRSGRSTISTVFGTL